MIQHCPVLIVLLPLTAALLCLLFSKFNKNLGSWLVIGSIAGSLACSLQVLHQTLTSGEAIHYWMGIRADTLLYGQLGTAFGH